MVGVGIEVCGLLFDGVVLLKTMIVTPLFEYTDEIVFVSLPPLLGVIGATLILIIVPFPMIIPIPVEPVDELELELDEALKDGGGALVVRIAVILNTLAGTGRTPDLILVTIVFKAALRSIVFAGLPLEVVPVVVAVGEPPPPGV